MMNCEVEGILPPSADMAAASSSLGKTELDCAPAANMALFKRQNVKRTEKDREHFTAGSPKEPAGNSLRQEFGAKGQGYRAVKHSWILAQRERPEPVPDFNAAKIPHPAKQSKLFFVKSR
jgi:hypothetical protein